MPVPTHISELSQTAASNNPPGSESPSTADDYLRTHAAFIATLRDGKGHSAEVDVASAATTDIGAANSAFVRITGTTTITSFGTNYNGPRFIRFAAALTLTHNASSLILPGGANIVTVAGDTCIATPISGGWVVSDYTRASGRSLVGPLTLGTAVNATSGTVIDFTGIPSWARRITVMFFGVSTSGTSQPMVQIGDSGGIETTDYGGAGGAGVDGSTFLATSFTTGFTLRISNAANFVHGAMHIERLSESDNTWIASGTFGLSSSNVVVLLGGSKTLSATLDRVRITTAGGTDTFDAGVVSINYE